VSWQDWVVLACVVVAVGAFWLARRSAGRKRIQAIAGALAQARASGYAAATVEFEARLAAVATANQTTTVVVGHDRAGRSVDAGIARAVLDRVAPGVDALASDRPRELIAGDGPDIRTGADGGDDGAGVLVAGVRAPVGSGAGAGELMESLTLLERAFAEGVPLPIGAVEAMRRVRAQVDSGSV